MTFNFPFIILLFFLLEIISRFLFPYNGKFATVVPVLYPVARAATLVDPP